MDVEDYMYNFLLIDINIDYSTCRYCKRMLYIAVKLNNISAVKFLLAKGIDPNMYDEYYRTPLHYAVDNNSVELVDVLLRYNTDPDIVDDNFEYPIVSSIRRGYICVAKLLVAYGADTTIINDFDIIHDSVKHGKIKMIEFLIHIGVSTLITDAEGHTPLHYAMSAMNRDMVLYLVNHIISNDYTLYDDMIHTILCNYDKYDYPYIELVISYFVLLEYLYGRATLPKIHFMNTEMISKATVLDRIRKNCENEIIDMMSTYINTHLTVLDICKDITNSNLLAKHVTLLEKFYEAKSRIYKEYIKPFIDVGIDRLNLLNTAIYVIDKHCDETSWEHLPIEIKYMILEYMDDSEIVYLSEYRNRVL
ncbi:ankyrin repeat family protein [Turkeypox virus]|uniref:Ankyrin repeat family protein n=1 Tax=Turkeypox virus TaxID=336486 RepID=A0A0M3PB69_9POXV|nr:ankyrin repeat family protein [Turkeypox virus]ALA62536.1 ankyrin repeat family protein [Turkeypox virus]